MSWFPASRRGVVAAGALVCGAVVFAGFGLARLVGGASVEVLTLPFALLAADLLIATALITGWYPVRPVAQGLAIFGALVHLLVALRSGPVWMRGWSGLVSVLHVYSLLLLFAISAREQYEDELDEEFNDDLVAESETRAESAAGATAAAQRDADGSAAEEPEVRERPTNESAANETADQELKAIEHPAAEPEAAERAAEEPRAAERQPEEARPEESPAEEAAADKPPAELAVQEQSPAEHTEADAPPADQPESMKTAAEDEGPGEPAEAAEAGPTQAEPTQAEPIEAELADRRAEQPVEQPTETPTETSAETSAEAAEAPAETRTETNADTPTERAVDEPADASNGESVAGRDRLPTADLGSASGQSAVGAGRGRRAERREED